MIRIKHILPLLLLALPLSITSCDSEPARIDFVQEGDYSRLLEAVRSADRSLSAKMALIENALRDGLTSDQQVIALIEEALGALEGSASEKLADIEQAIQDQTTTLQTKLSLLETAVRNGFTDAMGGQALLLQAVQSLDGTVEEKLAAIEEAVASQTTSLETKAGLIEAAAQSGFADSARAQDLAAKAIESMNGTAEEKSAAVETAVKNGAASLEAKILLIGTAVQNGLVDESGRRKLIQAAVEALGGTLTERLSAVQSAMGSQTSGLEDKIGLVVSTLESGLSGVNTAIGNLQKALDTSLKGLDPSLSTLKSDISKKLQAIAGKVTPAELSKALQGVLDAANKGKQTTEGLLKSIQEALDAIRAGMQGERAITALIYLGHPTEAVTVTCGNTLRIPLRVNPSDATLTADMLSMACENSKQFFLPGADRSLAVKDHYPSFTLAADPEIPGQYVATVRTLVDGSYNYWDESSLVFKAKTGDDRYVSTQPIPVRIMPNPKDGLSVSVSAKTASFLISNGKGVEPTPGSIYQPLVSVSFSDGSETRTYGSEFLTSAVFNPSGNLKVNASLNPEKHFVALTPDPTDSGWDTLRDSTTVKHLEAAGTLTLEDRWGGTLDISLTGLAWYTSFASVVLENPAIGNDGTLSVNLSNEAKALGLNLGDEPGSTYCQVDFDFESVAGAWTSAQFEPYSWNLKMTLGTYPSGSSFAVDAVVTQTVQPDEGDSSFRPVQRKGRIRVKFTVK